MLECSIGKSFSLPRPSELAPALSSISQASAEPGLTRSRGISNWFQAQLRTIAQARPLQIAALFRAQGPEARHGIARAEAVLDLERGGQASTWPGSRACYLHSQALGHLPNGKAVSRQFSVCGGCHRSNDGVDVGRRLNHAWIDERLDSFSPPTC